MWGNESEGRGRGPGCGRARPSGGGGDSVILTPPFPLPGSLPSPLSVSADARPVGASGRARGLKHPPRTTAASALTQPSGSFSPLLPALPSSLQEPRLPLRCLCAHIQTLNVVLKCKGWPITSLYEKGWQCEIEAQGGRTERRGDLNLLRSLARARLLARVGLLNPALIHYMAFPFRASVFSIGKREGWIG